MIGRNTQRASAIRRVASASWMVLVLVAVAAVVLRDAATVSESFRLTGATNVTLAALLLLTGKLLLGETFGAVARGGGVALSFWHRQRAYHLSQLAKYLPGFVWQFASKGVMLVSRGATRQQSVRIITMEQIWLILGALSTGGLLFLVAGFLDWNATRGRFALAIGPAALGVVALLVVAGTLSARMASASGQGITLRLREAGALLVAWLALSASFASLGLSANAGDDYRTALTLAAAFPLAYIGGYVTPFAPGGIGIREGLLVVLVAPQIGVARAASAALISRIVAVFVELILGAALVSPRRPMFMADGKRQQAH